MKIIKTGKMHNALYQYKNTRGTFWGYRLKYYDDSNKRKEKRGSSFISEREAFADLVETQMKIEKGLITSKNDYTVAEWYEKHIEMNKPNVDGKDGRWSQNTFTNRVSVFNDYIKPLIGDIKIKKLTLTLYQSLYIDTIRKELSPSSVHLYHKFVLIAFNAAIKHKIITEHDLNSATLPTIREINKEKFIDVNQLKTVLNDFKDNENFTNYAVIKTLSYTGIRVGELRALKWKNIDFENCKIQIFAQMTKHKYGPTKGNNKRLLPVDRALIDLLKEYKKWCIKRKSGILNQEDFVFISEQKGTVIGSNTLIYACRRSNDRTGLSITPHTLRHSHSAILIMQNRSLKAISKRLGNSEEVLRKHYGHVIDSVDIDTMDAFSEAMNEESGAKTGAKLTNIKTKD